MQSARTSNGVPWSLAGRLLARDWRSGEVVVLFAALVIAVAAMSAVTFFTDRVRQAVSQQAGEALAAEAVEVDARLHHRRRRAADTLVESAHGIFTSVQPNNFVIGFPGSCSGSSRPRASATLTVCESMPRA